MKRVLGWIFNRWTLLALLLAALAALVWIVGPLVAVGTWRPLEREGARWATLGTIGGLVLLALAGRAWRARSGNAEVVDRLLAAAPGAGREGSAESADLAAVRQRFEQALQSLKRARFGDGGAARWKARLDGRYLYELPWYLMIGAPGSGKTTALKHAGLKFPLGQDRGNPVLRGVGGTRHCDWWFTDRAVLIDTAGRFTTQDSDAAADAATWAGFLRLLKTGRKRQPINGVLVTVSITDLLARSAEERAGYASAVRERLRELDTQLAIRFPVYLLVTKCDLLAGFVESFERLDKTERAAAWGYTEAGHGPLGPLEPAFDALVQRLADGLPERLQAEGDAARRTRLYGFPLQFSALRDPLLAFVDDAFAPGPGETPALLRGAYFVSGTQEGTPIDRLLGSVARSFRLERALVAPHREGGRSYFLERLLGDVVFVESGLAGLDLRFERRRRAAIGGAYALIGVLALGTFAAWGTSWFANRAYVQGVAARAEQVGRLVQATPNRHTPDLQPIEPALAATKALADASPEGDPPLALRFGLFQGAKLDSAAQSAYRRMLADAFLPRLALRIEDQLRAGDTPETQYEALRAYLMMRDTEHFDAAALKAYLQADWDARLRELTVPERARLDAHLDALLAEGVVASPLAEDKAVVAAARNRLGGMTLPQRVYSRMRQAGVGRDLPSFDLVRVAGPQAQLVFARASGRPLTQGPPGLYSYDGYHRRFQRLVDEVSQQLADEAPWVMGTAGAREPADAPRRGGSAADVSDAVRRLYLADYAEAWEGFIADIRLQPMASLAQSVQMARTLSAHDNPLVPMVKALSRETTLGAKATDRDAIDKAGDKVREAFKGPLGRLGRAAPGTADAAGDGRPPEALVDDRFAALRLQANPSVEGGKAPVEETVALVAEVHLLLNAVKTAIEGGQTPAPSPLPNRVRTEAARQPEPLRSLLDTLGQGSGRAAQIEVRGNLSRLVNAEIGEFCHQALNGRYPLDRSATRDATQADFAAVFAPGGRIDRTFADKIGSYVDTSRRPWRFKPVEGNVLGTDSGTLPEFQRAQVIRETFFGSGAQPSLKLDFKPVEMDPAITQFVLDIDGQLVRYAHGPQIPASVQWPGPRGSSQVRVQVLPPGLAAGIVTEGPWALFRLFDRSDKVKLEPAGAPERFKASFDLDGRKVVFEVTASSVRNPFRLPELNEFACPARL